MSVHFPLICGLTLYRSQSSLLLLWQASNDERSEKYKIGSSFSFGKCSKISNISCLQKRTRQTVKTEISLKKQSDQGLPCLLFRQVFVNSSLDNQYFICEYSKKSV